MNTDIKKAIELMKNEQYTLTAVNGDKIITSRERGVRPLLELTDKGMSLKGYSVSDKVIGKAAAFLYVLLRPDEIYTGVISRPALEVLQKHGIKIKYDVLADAIENRSKTGYCPMETAVMGTDDADKALELIHIQLEKLSKS